MLRQQRSGKPLVLLLIDIDHFKTVNDTHGRIAGDICFKTIALTLASDIRAIDLVAHFGGEEFLVLLTDSTLAEGADIAEKLRHAVENTEIRIADIAHPQRVTISIGLVEMPADAQQSLDSLIERADAGVYRAKDGGRNRVCLSD